MALTRKQLNAINSSPALKELKDWIIAMDAENEPYPIKKYFFISYGEAACTTELGRGACKTTGVTQSGYVQVVVTENDSTSEDFVGNKYFVVDTAAPDNDTGYQLYGGAGSDATGMYVKIYTVRPEPPAEEEKSDDS